MKKYNYAVTIVKNGIEAMETVKNEDFNLILMDIMLPGMNGYEITGEIRKLEKERGTEKKVPIIAITANTLDNDREKCIQAGMNDYLSKPFTAEQLINKIKMFL